MIPFASQRGGGQDLATHLMNAYDNEVTEIAHMRGAVSGDLHGAFKEWEAQADALTRCEKYLYSLSINPDPRQGRLTREQYMDYIARTETMLGLEHQPRAVIFHVKHGREHCHIVWCRIDAEQGKAVHLAFDHDKLMRVTRAFARDHGLRLPPGYEKSRQAGQESLYQREQARQTGLTKADHTRLVTEAWAQSDTATAFVQALAERGYILATGDRPYVVVDLYGGVNALPRLIDDKSVRTADVRSFLAQDFPTHALPGVEEARKLVADHRALVERSVAEDLAADQLAILRQSQQDRRALLAMERKEAEARSSVARVAQQQEHRAQRDRLRHDYRQRVRDIRAARERDRPSGLAAFLGRVTGIDAIRRAIHRHQDGQRLKVYRAEVEALRERQCAESRALEARTALHARDASRKEAALARVERRELAALLRDQRTAQRVQARGGGDRMAPVEHLLAAPMPPPATDPRQLRDDTLAAFEHARGGAAAEVPDLLAAFAHAVQEGTGRGEVGGAGDTLGLAAPPDGPQRGGPDRGRGR